MLKMEWIEYDRWIELKRNGASKKLINSFWPYIWFRVTNNPK